jgi:hypothetical protein
MTKQDKKPKIPPQIKDVPSLTKNPLVDIFLTYQFIKRIIVPFEKWDAYKLGIIDKNGKVLKKRGTLKTKQEKAAWGYFDILTANLKKLLAKVPAANNVVGSSVASYLLIKENKSEALLNEFYFEVRFKEVYEEIAGMNTGDTNMPANHASSDIATYDPILIKKKLRRKKPDVAP